MKIKFFKYAFGGATLQVGAKKYLNLHPFDCYDALKALGFDVYRKEDFNLKLTKDQAQQLKDLLHLI